MSDVNFRLEGRRIYVAGHTGMVGSAVLRRLATERCEILVRDHRQLDLTRQVETESFMADAKPEVVIIAAARVGGILANDTNPADFLRDNLAIQQNLIASSYQYGVRKLLFLGSSCIYPKFAPQPMTEEMLLTGPLEPTNEWYAIAKIAGIKLCQAYRRQYHADYVSLMPTNLYGPGDNYHPEYSHVPAALIGRMHEAKLACRPSVTVWGTGKPLREFMFVDDLADACAHVLKHYSGEQFLNAGSSEEISIADFAKLVAEVVGYSGRLVFDASRPDGTPRKLLDSSKLRNFGWKPRTKLRDGLAATYADFLKNGGRVRERLSATAMIHITT
jgi:GDP-L-fucose synthase